MTEIEAQIVATWRIAAHELAIEFSSPYTVFKKDSVHLNCIGFVHRFGRRLGTIISVLNEPSHIALPGGPWADKDYFNSILGPGYRRYDRQLFIEILDDWQFFGVKEDCPSWYSGKCWGSA